MGSILKRLRKCYRLEQRQHDQINIFEVIFWWLYEMEWVKRVGRVINLEIYVIFDVGMLEKIESEWKQMNFNWQIFDSGLTGLEKWETEGDLRKLFEREWYFMSCQNPGYGWSISRKVKRFENKMLRISGIYQTYWARGKVLWK